jgi:diacylglycerol kinase (ATP)
MYLKQKIFDSNSSAFSWKARFKSFACAWNGIIQYLRKEINAQIHLAASVLVIVLSVTLRVNKSEAIAVVFSMALVWITEMINTAIEKTMDFISIKTHARIKFIKDVAAGAVLIAAIAALFVGAIVFVPKLMKL